MSSDKEIIIEISSDDDEDYTIVHPCKRHGVRPQPQETTSKQEASNSVSAAATAAFAQCVETAVPIKLVPQDLAAYIQHASNVRLDKAREAGVATEEMYIGDDCLPTWPGMGWDPEEQSLHLVIQGRLLDYEISQGLCDLLRREIIVKGNRRLEKAREMGVGLGDMFFGESLLATWPKCVGVRVDVEEESDGGHDVTADDLADDEMDYSYESNTESDVSSLADDIQKADSPVAMESPIWMNNFVGPEPSCAEEQEEELGGSATTLAHIIQGVELVGAPMGVGDVDLEIYVADQDEEDLEELPELEMVVDGDAWGYWVGDVDGGVDVEIEDLEIACTGELVGYDDEEEDEDEDEDEESVYESCQEEDFIKETEYGYEW